MWDSSLNTNVYDPSTLGAFRPQSGPQYAGGHMPQGGVDLKQLLPYLLQRSGQGDNLMAQLQMRQYQQARQQAPQRAQGQEAPQSMWQSAVAYSPEMAQRWGEQGSAMSQVPRALRMPGQSQADSNAAWLAAVNSTPAQMPRDTAGQAAYNYYWDPKTDKQNPGRHLNYGETSGPSGTTDTWGQDLQASGYGKDVYGQMQQEYADALNRRRIQAQGQPQFNYGGLEQGY